MGDRSEQPIEARWNDQLQIQPQQQFQRIVLTGGAEFKSAATGQLDAREIEFLLLESPASAPILGQHNEQIFCGRLGYHRTRQG